MSDDRENTAADPGAIPGTSSGAEPAMRGEGEEASSRLVPAVALRAHELSTRDGEPSFPRQDQQPPGLTAPMRPVPDHGEHSYIGHGRLHGLSTLITGGDSGIGRAVAIAFAREGADVALSYLPEEQEDAEETGRWIEQAGRRALLLPGDIREERWARSLVTRTREEFGRLDVLVNNAAFQWGRAEPAGLAGIDSARLHRTLTTTSRPCSGSPRRRRSISARGRASSTAPRSRATTRRSLSWTTRPRRRRSTTSP